MSGKYQDLRYNEVSFKAAHNSYQRDETLVEQIAWHPNDPSDAGCRAVELDISQSDNGLEWSVGHDAGYETNYRQLSQFLAELRAWGMNHPGHDVITVYLDLKHVATDSFPDQLDQYIRDYLSDCRQTPVYTPGELMRDAPSVPDGAQKYGWPTLGELCDRFIICVTGNAGDKATYAATDPKNRLCFADKDQDADEAPSSDDRVFFNYHLYSDDKNEWCPVFKDAAGRRDAIIRGYVLNGEELWSNALDCGCHALATDKIKHYGWAKVGTEPFVRLKPLV
ncbi:MAG: Ca2+-dependent phosphoinositide-specific phospholipase C [Longimicrobiaceae bacterium]